MLADRLMPPVPPDRTGWTLISLLISLWIAAAAVSTTGILTRLSPLAVFWIMTGPLTASLLMALHFQRQARRFRGVSQILVQLVEEAPIGVQLKDMDLRFIWFNKAHSANRGLWHRSAESLIGKTVQEAGFEPGFAETVTAHDRAAIAARTAMEPREQILDRPGGGVDRIILTTKVPLIHRGSVLYVATMSADTSVWREAQQRNEEERRLLQTVMDAAPVMVQVIDRDMRFRWVNKAYRDAFTTGDTEMVGASLTDLQGVQHLLPQTLAINQEMFDTGRGPVRYEQYLPPTDDRPAAYQLITKIPIKNKNGSVVQILTMGTDITEVHRLRAEAEAARKRLQLIVETVPVTLALKDRDRRYVWANPAFCNVGRHSLADTIGRRIDDLDPGHALLDAVREADEMALTTGREPPPMEQQLRTIDGQKRTLSVRRVPVHGDDGEVEGLLVVGVDVTAQHSIAAALRAMTEELERRVAERTAELAKANDLVTAVIKSTPVPIVVFWPNCTVQIANQAALTVTGVADVAELDPLFGRQPEGIRNTFHLMHDRVMRGESSVGHEVRLTRADGTVMELIVSSAPLSPVDGAVGGMVTGWLDVTEQRRADAEIRRWFEAFQQAGVGLALTRGPAENPIIIGANQLAEKMWSAPHRAMIGESPSRLHHPEDMPRVIEAFQDADRSGHAAFETRVRRLDGTEFYAAFTIDLVTLTGDPVTTRVCTITDITDKKRLEAERDLWADAIEHAAYGIAITDAGTDHRLAVNPSYARLHGRTVAEILDRPVETLYAEDHIHIHGEIARTSDRIGHAEANAVRVRADGTTFPVRISATTVFNDDRKPLYRIATVIDMTDQRRIEDQLQHARKMEAMGQLTGGISHDFNNLLAIQILSLEHLAELLHDQPEAAELADSSLKAALSGAALTQRMLAFARRQVLEPRVVPLSELVHDVASLLRQTLGERVRLVLRVAPGTWPVFVDTVQLEASLINLAANARDAMPRGGTFSIHTGNFHLDSGTEGDLPHGDYVLIEVTDTGTGMTEDVRQRAFEPFFTTKPVGQGSGLGLSMVFGFISQSKGTIAIESAPGRGTTFRLLLPRTMEVLPETRPEPPPPTKPGHGECVLIVDDDAGVRAMLIRLIKALGYCHLVAENGDDALTILERQDVDIVLSDVVMPGAIDGLALARLVRTRWPHTKVILSSGYVNAKANGQGMTIPDGVSFLAKPYNMKRLALALADTLAAGDD